MTTDLLGPQRPQDGGVAPGGGDDAAAIAQSARPSSRALPSRRAKAPAADREAEDARMGSVPIAS